MKTSNMLKTIILLLVLSVFAACSDSITSVGDFKSAEYPLQSGDVQQGVPLINVFKANIWIKPNSAYTFSYFNTPLIKFTSVDVEAVIDPDKDIIALDCQDLEVYTELEGQKPIGCHAKEFYSDRVIVTNIGTSFLELNVTLTGTPKKNQPESELSNVPYVK